MTPEDKRILDDRIEWLQLRMGTNHRLYWGIISHYPLVIDPGVPEGLYSMMDEAQIHLSPSIIKLEKERLFGLIARQANRVILHFTKPIAKVQFPDEWKAAESIVADMHVPDGFKHVDDEIAAIAETYKKRGLLTTAEVYLDRISQKNPPKVPEIDAVDREKDDPDRAIVNVLSAVGISERGGGKGNLPGEIQKAIDELGKPRINWVEVIRQYVGTKMGGWDLNPEVFAKSLFALGMLAPAISRVQGTPDAIFGIDSSGSMVGEPLCLVLSEFRGLFNILDNVLVFIADAGIQSEMKLSEFSDDEIMKLKEKVSGYGGTSFVPVFEEIKKRNLKPQLVVYFTDLQGTFPDEVPPYPVLWVTTSPGEVPWGDVIRIPPEELAGKKAR